MTDGLIAIPALTFRGADGRVDFNATAKYAARATATWLDVFILSGTTTQGDTFSVAERAAVLDLWVSMTTPDRLLACSWTAADISEAEARRIRPLAVMRDLKDVTAACAFFSALPAGSFVYSHPLHTPTVLDSRLVAAAREAECLPVGAKISKLPPGELVAIRRLAPARSFAVWDGSCRDLRQSFEHGATGVVATPLTVLPRPFPDRAVLSLQSALSLLQVGYDLSVTTDSTVDWLIHAATAPA